MYTCTGDPQSSASHNAKCTQFQLPHLHNEPSKNYKTLYVLLYRYVNIIEFQLLEENLYQWDLIIDHVPI